MYIINITVEPVNIYTVIDEDYYNGWVGAMSECIYLLR